MLNIVMKLNAMCGVVVDVFAGAFRRQCDNHGNLLAVHDIAETWKLSTATGILKVLPLDFLSNIIPVVRLHITFLFTYLCVAAFPSSLGSVKEVDIPKHVLDLKRTWDQKLSSGLLLTFMPVQPLLVQLRGCWSILTTKQDS